MGVSLEKIVSVTVTPSGYYLHISKEKGEIKPTDLLAYLASLRIADIQKQGVKEAFENANGAPKFIAPLPKAGANAPKAAQHAPKARRIVRWLKPYFNPGAPIRPAKNILVVDTTKAMVKAFNKSFNEGGIFIVHASQPGEFLTQISEKDPDLILLASKLGNIDGSLLSVKIRTTQKTSKVPVIMYSSARPRKEIITLFDSGITDYFVMPMQADFFRQKVQMVLSQVKKTIPMETRVSMLGGAVSKAASDVISSNGAMQEQTEHGQVNVNLRDLINKVKDMLAVPHILERVMKISSDAVSGAKDLAQAIRSDAATVAMVLRKANSVFFGKSEPIKEVQEAIVRIGLNEIKTLVLGMSVINQFSKERKTNGFDRSDFWKHSLTTAILGRIFGHQVKLQDPEDAFIGGLIHDIGKIIFDEYANPPYDDIVMAAIRNRTPIMEEEKNAFGFTHIDVGRSLVQSWKFPEYMEIIVSRHHSPESRAKERLKEQELLLVRIVYIANLLAKALQVGSGGDLSIHELPLSPWVQSFTKLKFDNDQIDELKKHLEEMAKFLEIDGEWTDVFSQAGSDLPEVFLVDPLQDARVINVTRLHLETAGYEVTSCFKETEINGIDDGKKQAICILVDSFDKLKDLKEKVWRTLNGKELPVVFILPEMEKTILEKTGELKRPDFLTEKESLLFEPYDTSVLHNCLEGVLPE